MRRICSASSGSERRFSFRGTYEIAPTSCQLSWILIEQTEFTIIRQSRIASLLTDTRSAISVCERISPIDYYDSHMFRYCYAIVLPELGVEDTVLYENAKKKQHHVFAQCCFFYTPSGTRTLDTLIKSYGQIASKKISSYYSIFSTMMAAYQSVHRFHQFAILPFAGWKQKTSILFSVFYQIRFT